MTRSNVAHNSGQSIFSACRKTGVETAISHYHSHFPCSNSPPMVVVFLTHWLKKVKSQRRRQSIDLYKSVGGLGSLWYLFAKYLAWLLPPVIKDIVSWPGYWLSPIELPRLNCPGQLSLRYFFNALIVYFNLMFTSEIFHCSCLRLLWLLFYFIIEFLFGLSCFPRLRQKLSPVYGWQVVWKAFQRFPKD